MGVFRILDAILRALSQNYHRLVAENVLLHGPTQAGTRTYAFGQTYRNWVDRIAMEAESCPQSASASLDQASPDPARS